jgi:ParB family chromosome partitioning protein
MTNLAIATDDTAPVNSIKAAALAILAGADKGTALKHVTDTKGEIFNVNPYLLEDSGTNFRNLSTPEAQAKLMELARSIAAVGVLEAMTAYYADGKNIVTNGHRRLAAVKIAIEELGANIKTVPVRLAPRGTNDADRKFDQFIRNSGEPPTTLETARLFKDMLGMGWTEEDLIEKSGKDKQHITRLLEIAEMPSEVHSMIERGEIAATFAHERYKANNNISTTTVTELKTAVETAKAAGKDKASKKHLPETATPAHTKRRRPADDTTATPDDAKTNDAAPQADTKASDKPATITKDVVLHAVSRMMRLATIDKYDRNGTPVNLSVEGMQEADYLLIRDYFRL